MLRCVPGSKKIPAYRDVEINLDASDRPEWCTVRHHGIFCPDNAYVVHLRWLVSTGSVINELVSPGQISKLFCCREYYFRAVFLKVGKLMFRLSKALLWNTKLTHCPVGQT